MLSTSMPGPSRIIDRSGEHCPRLSKLPNRWLRPEAARSTSMYLPRR